ncbi:orotate phosphoribosyltransferase [candidate division KSB1 bacterium]|nr:orotate phosphoribosyltransferase [candidate division KSB1 bacterium]
MNKNEILDIFKKSEALLDGHFRLTSGLHSPQYFQCAKVLQYPEYAEKLCSEIAARFDHISCVISPAIGGIVVGQEVGRLLKCRTIFSERQNNIMTLRRGFSLSPEDRVLAVEDVITTGGSIQEVIRLVHDYGSELAGVACIVDRSAGKAKFDARFFPVLEMQVVTFDPADCPLCRQGLPIVKPGSRKID